MTARARSDATAAAPAAAPSKPRSSGANGRLWGARARHWAEIQEGQFGPAYGAVFDACGVGPDTRYCDVGCGAGGAALLAARRGAMVTGLDAAESLLAVARERVPQGDFRHGDLEELPFADEQFDLVTGFNAFQFAADPVAALAEARRVARPGARVVVMTWGSLQALARAAGLQPLDVFDVDCHWQYPDLATGLRGLGASGVAVRAAEATSPQAVDDAHAQALSPFRQGDGSYHIGASVRWLLAAR